MHWYYWVGYFAIGLLFMCVLQYMKGRKSGPRFYDLAGDRDLDLLSAAAFGIWPILIGGMLAIAVLVGLVYPFVKLCEYCSNLGRKHGGE